MTGLSLDKLLELDATHQDNVPTLIKQKIEERMPKVRLEINAIIDTKSDSIEDIERILGNLLDYMCYDCGASEFNKLNNYYSTVNKENSEKYKIICERWFGEDD